MKFQCKVKDLTVALGRVTPVIPTKSTFPTVTMVYLQVENGKLIIRGMNNEALIETSMKIANAEPGGVLVQAKKFTDIVKAFGQTLDFNFSSDDDTYMIDIVSGKGKYQLPGVDPLERLDMEERLTTEKTLIAEITQPAAVYLAKKTLYAASKDEFRPAMNGVKLEFKADGIKAIATDSFRLATAYVGADISPAAFKSLIEFIIPAGTVKLLEKVDENVAISLSEDCKAMTFKYGDTLITSKSIDEKFPPYETIIPDSFIESEKYNLQALIGAINRVKLFAGEIENKVILNIGAGQVVISSQNEDYGEQATETLQSETFGDGTEIEIGFNHKYLQETLLSFNESAATEILFKLGGENKPAIIEQFESENDGMSMQALVMPVRLN